MKYESFLPEAQAKINDFMFNVVDGVVKNTERVVKKGFLDFPKPPIDTGNLRRNIVGKVIKQNNLEIVGEVRASTPLLVGAGSKNKGGKQVEYAKFIEYGTVRMSPRPFMRNGVKNAEQSNLQIIKRLIK